MDCQSKIVKKLYEYVERLTEKLSPKARYWFYRLLISVLLAVGMRRTVILFTLENSLHYRNQNDIVTGKESLPIRDW